ncbi:hypothetical protein [Desulfolithobacter sp.]
MNCRRETLTFNLPGGPPSNHAAFLLLVLPGILRERGRTFLSEKGLRLYHRGAEAADMMNS